VAAKNIQEGFYRFMIETYSLKIATFHQGCRAGTQEIPPLAPGILSFWLQLRLQHIKTCGSGFKMIWSMQDWNQTIVLFIQLAL